MKEAIRPLNEKGEAHGYWEGLDSDGDPWYRGTFDNGVMVGYWEETNYYQNGDKQYKKNYFIR